MVVPLKHSDRHLLSQSSQSFEYVQLIFDLMIFPILTRLIQPTFKRKLLIQIRQILCLRCFWLLINSEDYENHIQPFLFASKKHLFGTQSILSDYLAINCISMLIFLQISLIMRLIFFKAIFTLKLQPDLYALGFVANGIHGALGALGRRFESCRPDQVIATVPSRCFFIGR